MYKEILWVHEKALIKKRENLLTSKEGSKALFIWDDAYFRRRSYTLKRLVFIYEALCEMPVDIIQGDTLDILHAYNPQKIKTFFTVDTHIKQIIQKLSESYVIELIKPQPFVEIPDEFVFKRFFRYWQKARKTAFFLEGSSDA